MVAVVVCSSSLVACTFCDDAIKVSSVRALFCVVSERYFEMDNIFSVISFSCFHRRL